jgi:CSLREA domain-containing protein
LGWAILLAALFLLLAACGGADLSPTNCSDPTFEVNSFLDVNDGACNSGNCTLREAVEAANTCTVHPMYTIILPEGDYELSIRGPGDERGDLDLRRNVTIEMREGDTRLPAVIGPSTWNDRIFHIHPEVEAVFNDIWVKGGYSSSMGGGILNEGNLTIDHAIINENQADDYGAGLYNGGTADLYAVEFTENSTHPSSFDSCGGAIYNRGELIVREGSIHANEAHSGAGICSRSYGNGSLTVQRTYIMDNGKEFAGFHGVGGGISSIDETLTIEESTIQSNRALRGGGIYATYGEMTVVDSTITENHAGYGGGFFIGPSAHNVRIHGSEISQNLAQRIMGRGGEWGGGRGGGVLSGTSDIDLFQSPLLNNTAEILGGGLHLDDPTGAQGYFSHAAIVGNSNPNGPGGGVAILNGHFLIVNATLSGNETPENGIALYNGAGAQTRLLHVTMADNTVSGSSRYVRPIFNEEGGQLGIKNSLIVGVGDDMACWGDRDAITSEGGNVIAARYLCFGNRRTDDVDIPWTSRYGGRTYLPLAEIDGTLVHPLPLDSLAAEFVATSQCNRDDQRLASRPQGELCEAGAYELDASAMTTTSEPIVIGTPTPVGPTATATAAAACPAQLTFQDAAFGSISYRAGQGETLVVLQVPGEKQQENYPATINGQAFQCDPSNEFPDRLFCVGPRLVEGAQADLALFGDGCTEPVFETTFSIPFPLYPTPTATLKPTSTCDPQQQQCQ